MQCHPIGHCEILEKGIDAISKSYGMTVNRVRAVDSMPGMQPGLQSTLDSIVFRSKCWLSASALSRVPLCL